MATQRTSVAKPPNVLYLSNLAYEASREALVEWFEEHGLRVMGVQLLKKGPKGRQTPSGLACVTLDCGHDVNACCKLLDGRQVLGRPVIVRRNGYVDDDPSYTPAAADTSAT